MKVFPWLGLVTLLVAAGQAPMAGLPSFPNHPDPDRVEAPGLHNVFRLTERLFSGSAPEGDEGFQSLQKLGIKTILSVDGAAPDVVRAHRYGMRYVHLPFGYDGIPDLQAQRLAKAVRDLPGPMYIHCHHGQHRGPAAAAVAHLCLDPKCQVETVLAEMRRAGTDPRYTGLYAAPRKFHRPTMLELDRLSGAFPEVAPVAGLAQVMVGIDERWENLKKVRLAGWKVPADHPDLDPPHEALQLMEAFREAGRLPRVRARPEELQGWLAEAEAKAQDLEAALRPGKGQAFSDSQAADRLFSQLSATCSHCHGKYRDVPQ